MPRLRDIVAQVEHPLTLEMAQRMKERQTPAWKMHAVRLCFERHLESRTRITSSEEVADLHHHHLILSCPSATIPRNHSLAYFTELDVVICSCESGTHLNPCAHVGSALLFLYELAPEARR